jgi:hypothetical protein
MNCEDIGNLLDNREILKLTPDQQSAVSEHLRGCERCNSEWRAVRALWEVATVPTPAPRAQLFSETMRLATSLAEYRGGQPAGGRPPSFWLGAGLGGALAAGIVIAIMGGNPVSQSTQQTLAGTATSTPSITIALNEPRDVDVAISSAAALTGAQIRVVLTGGVRLAGYRDRSVVSWQTDLDAGVNRLTLPVLAINPGGGQVLVEVEHSSKRQIFVVNVGVEAADEPA